jgi:hypothetical protein
MPRCTTRLARTLLLLAFALVGPLGTSRLKAADEDKVRETFQAFQAALKAKDAAKIWKLLDADSQAAAERAAKQVQAAYKKANATEKAKMEKAMELSGEELAKLTGEGFLKTKNFQSKYHEVPGSKIEKIVVQDDKATVNYIEEDNDKEKLRLSRNKDGEWKVSAPMPPVG